MLVLGHCLSTDLPPTNSVHALEGEGFQEPFYSLTGLCALCLDLASLNA
jgi:hypothetical protein